MMTSQENFHGANHARLDSALLARRKKEGERERRKNDIIRKMVFFLYGIDSHVLHMDEITRSPLKPTAWHPKLARHDFLPTPVSGLSQSA